MTTKTWAQEARELIEAETAKVLALLEGCHDLRGPNEARDVDELEEFADGAARVELVAARIVQGLALASDRLGDAFAGQINDVSGADIDWECLANCHIETDTTPDTDGMWDRYIEAREDLQRDHARMVNNDDLRTR